MSAQCTPWQGLILDCELTEDLYNALCSNSWRERPVTVVTKFPIAINTNGPILGWRPDTKQLWRIS